MLDVPGGVSPPDEQDDAANKKEQKQKSQRIEMVWLAIPIGSLGHRCPPPLSSTRARQN